MNSALDSALANFQAPDILGAFRRGQERGRETSRRNRVESALSSYATNPADSENALIAAGEVGTARTLGDMRRQREQQDTRKKVGTLAQTDMGAARKEALGAGEFDLAEGLAGMEEAERQQALKGLEIIGAVAHNLKRFPVEQRASIAAHMAPDLGIPPEQLAHMTFSDEELDGLLLPIERAKAQYFNTSKGIAAVDPEEGSAELILPTGDDEQDALKRQLLEAQIDATRAYVPLREAQADKARRAPAPRSSGALPANGGSGGWVPF